MYIVISHTLVFHMDVMFRNKVIELNLIYYIIIYMHVKEFRTYTIINFLFSLSGRHMSG